MVFFGKAKFCSSLEVLNCCLRNGQKWFFRMWEDERILVFLCCPVCLFWWQGNVLVLWCLDWYMQRCQSEVFGVSDVVCVMLASRVVSWQKSDYIIYCFCIVCNGQSDLLINEFLLVCAVWWWWKTGFEMVKWQSEAWEKKWGDKCLVCYFQKWGKSVC